MNLTDPIADMFTRIRNSLLVKKDSVCIPYSKIKFIIAQKLLNEGFFINIEVKDVDNTKQILITLKYYKKESVLQELKRVSTPGKRIYISKSEIPRIRNGFGTALLSTSKGVLTGKEARIANVGGEYLGYAV